MKKHTYKHIKEYFEKYNWKLLSKEYKNANTKLEAECEKEHICWITFNNFKQGYRCAECAGVKKFTYEFVKGCFEKYNWKLLSKEYINCKEKLEAECEDGHTCWIAFSTFQQGYRCLECSGNKKHAYKYVREYFEKYNWKLISKEYKNANTKLEVECEEKHICWITFGNFQQGHRCPVCYNKRKKGKGNPNWRGGIKIAWFDTYAHQIDWIEEVKKDPDNKDYLQAKCTNCNKWFNPTALEVQNRIKAFNAEDGRECRFYCSDKCKKECPMFGKIKYLKGQEPYYVRDMQKEWADMVKERDDYTCIKCGRKDLPLVAHHIEGLNQNPIESADIDLGITVCSECDKLIHSEVGCRPIDLQRKAICEKERIYVSNFNIKSLKV